MSRELLEKAAKAAGIDRILWNADHSGGWLDGCGAPSTWWNPLTDDGDAFRLAVKRRFHVCIFSACESEGIQSPGFVEIWVEGGADPIHVEHVQDADYDAATRLAIVRAAAAMGEKP